MPISLFRVDERLIHGQVVVGWGGHLRPGKYVVVDSMLAESQWEQELYSLGVPAGVDAEYFDPEVARGLLPDWMESDVRTVVLTRDLATMLVLASDGLLDGEEVNLGGLHARKGRDEVLPYLFLDQNDREALEALAAEGVTITAQNLPGAPKVRLGSLLA
jgi:mannose/fructose/N-acetylgalactosamine-specific phosphotransferase system component IIB